MKISSLEVKNWVDTNLPPLSWSVLTVLCMKDFINEDITYYVVSKDILYSENIFNKLSKEILRIYERDITKDITIKNSFVDA